MPEMPTASAPMPWSAATSSALTTPRSTASTTSSAASSVTRRPSWNRALHAEPASHSVRRLPPPWTSTTSRVASDGADLRRAPRAARRASCRRA